MRLRIHYAVLLMGVASVISSGQLEAQTITNPSFEVDTFSQSPGYIGGDNGFITGWLTSSAAAGVNNASGPFYESTNGSIPDGNQVAFAQNPMIFRTSPSTPVTGLVVGETYKVSYYDSARVGQGGMLSYFLEIDHGNDDQFDGFIVADNINPRVVSSEQFEQVTSIEFVAQSTTAALQFITSPTLSWNGDATIMFDDFQIRQVIQGDFNDDGVVDAADYTAWRDAFESGGTLPNDPTPGSVTQADYQVWASNFGLGGAASATAAAVPEPTAAGLALIGVIAVLRRRQ